jgi:carboxymethylenebutenolidase
MFYPDRKGAHLLFPVPPVCKRTGALSMAYNSGRDAVRVLQNRCGGVPEVNVSGEMILYGDEEKHNGYLAAPEGGGPGVLVLHAWWGLNDIFKSVCDRLAAEGYVAFAPDLFQGRVASTIHEAKKLVEIADSEWSEFIGEAADEAVDVLLHRSQSPRIGVIGFSFGAAWASVLAAMRPANVVAVVLFYGAYAPDLTPATAAFLGHFAENDPYEPRVGMDELQSALKAVGRPATFYVYEGTGHWFFEPDRRDAYNPEAAQLAWERTLAFLAEQLRSPLPQ